MIYDLMIIGGGPAGLSAGLYAARARLSAAVLTDGGGQVTSTSEIENYLGIENIDGFELDRLFTEHAVKMGAKIIRGRAEALSDGGEIKTIKTRDGELSARAVILAMGATHRELGLESERRLFGSGVSYCATCDGAFFRGKDVAIVGGGNTALEDALYLANVCRTVYLVHRRDAFRGEKALADRVRQKENIKIQYDSAVSKIRGESAVSSVLLENTKTGAQQELPVSAVFVAIGLIPENEIFSRQLPLDDNGYFVAGEDCKTLLEGVFVAGDCRSKLLRQIITAAADGAVAGYQAAAYVNGI